MDGLGALDALMELRAAVRTALKALNAEGKPGAHLRESITTQDALDRLRELVNA